MYQRTLVPNVCLNRTAFQLEIASDLFYASKHLSLSLFELKAHVSFLVTWVTKVTYWYGLVSIVVRRPLTSSSQELVGQSLPDLVCITCKGKRNKIENFMTHQPTYPKGTKFWINNCKIDLCYKNIFFSTPGHKSHKMSTCI